VPLELRAIPIPLPVDAAPAGSHVDDEVDAEAKFPTEHSRKELGGKVGRFHVKVKDVKHRVLPALDDEFAQDVGSFQTLVELRADVHTRLEKMLEDRAESMLAQQIVERLNDKNPLDLPPSLVEQQCKIMELELLQNARRAGQKVGAEDIAKVHEQVHADAEKKVRAGLLMAAIAKKLEVKVGDGDIQKARRASQETGKNVAKLRAEYNDPQRRQVLIE
jgi:trigger factor